MKTSWKLSRYSRCYSNHEHQYTDVNGNPLFSLLPAMKQHSANDSQGVPNFQFSQNVTALLNAGTWTAITSDDERQLELELEVISESRCLFRLLCHQSSVLNKTKIILELFCFPDAFDFAIKVSPKCTSLGFRYFRNQNQYLFQAIFEDQFNCKLCYDQLLRFGILTPAWPLNISNCLDQGMKWPKSGCDAAQNNDDTGLKVSTATPCPHSAPPGNLRASIQLESTWFTQPLPRNDQKQKYQDDPQNSSQPQPFALPSARILGATNVDQSLGKAINSLASEVPNLPPLDLGIESCSSQAKESQSILVNADSKTHAANCDIIILSSEVEYNKWEEELQKDQERARRVILNSSNAFRTGIERLEIAVATSEEVEPFNSPNSDDFFFLRAASYEETALDTPQQ